MHGRSNIFGWFMTYFARLYCFLRTRVWWVRGPISPPSSGAMSSIKQRKLSRYDWTHRVVRLAPKPPQLSFVIFHFSFWVFQSLSASFDLYQGQWKIDQTQRTRAEETIQSGKVTESFVPFYGKDQIMPSQMEVAPPDAVSGLDCWIILYLRLHLLQEHCWCCAEKKKTRRRCLLEMVENRTPHLTQPILRGWGTK